jgi:glucose-6-phosphate 1-dehydrogenase
MSTKHDRGRGEASGEYGSRRTHEMDPHVFVIFGATGDLTKRLILPALYELTEKGSAQRFVVLGVARSEHDDAGFQRECAEALHELGGVDADDAQAWCERFVTYECIGEQQQDDYRRIKQRADALADERELGPNRLFYLALPPSVFDDTVVAINEAGLCAEDGGWTRIVVEKPFGRSLETARELNALLHRFFREEQIYRIDHFLGKETVQNLLVFRFGNAIFEQVWNRENVARVEILVPETLTVGSRAGYYDKSGAIRDMVQNHLTQLLTLTAMEPPASPRADDIQAEKVKVLRSILPLEPKNVVLGRYGAGEAGGEEVRPYLEEDDVPDDSKTETFAAIRLFIENWRWQGVPFVLVTGKAMAEKSTRIRVVFRRAPVSIFSDYDRCNLSDNVLEISAAPHEGFSLTVDVKTPGSGFDVQTQRLHFDYGEAFGPSPTAYHTLLEDVATGDRTLFVDAAEAEASWALYQPILDRDLPVHEYRAGTWGPLAARRFFNVSLDQLW